MPPRPKRQRCPRVRIGRVSVYFHHQAWWIYFRQDGRPVRKRVSPERAAAETAAAEINAQLAVRAPTMFGFTPVGVAELRQRFLTDHETVLRSSPATISPYRSATQHLAD